MSWPILSVTIKYEEDVVVARQRAKQIAHLLGFDLPDQTRIATAVSEIARNARQTSRMLDELLASNGDDIDEGIDLYTPSSKLASGRLFLQTEAISSELPQGLR